MFRRYPLVLVVIMFAHMLGGCAVQRMPFSDESQLAANNDKVVYLMSATIKNSYKSKHQLRLVYVDLEKGPVSGSGARLVFKMDDKGRDGDNNLIRLELEKGEYVIRRLQSLSKLPPHGIFYVPIHAKVVSSVPGIYYLGHIEANVRERKGEEFKAGPSFPAFDQSITGATSGTFDIEISDQWVNDEVKFKERFPILKSATIQKAILPAFDRNFAQTWWEKN